MMLRWVYLLSLAIEVSSQSCEFCPGNAAPGKPDFVLLGGLTCADFDLLSNEYSVKDCAELKNSPYPFLCNCPGLQGTCSGICPDGTAVGRPDLLVPTEGVTCSEYDSLAKTTSDSAQCTTYQKGYSGYCGCAGVTPTCSGICQDGETISKPDVISFVGTCANYDTTLRFVLASNPSCFESQKRYSGVCGCVALKPTTNSTSTAKPTSVPTAKPTSLPTAQPTSIPTAKPTAKSTSLPTAQPTAKPTSLLTAQPTSKPSSVPTSSPALVPKPPAPTTSPGAVTFPVATTKAPVVAAPVTAPLPNSPIVNQPVEFPASSKPAAMPSLTVAPAKSPTPAPPFKICFSGETTVHVKDSRGTVFMKDLRLGDQVLVEAGKYEAVYSFGHRDESSEASFLRLLPSNMEISMDHMVKIAGGRYVPASAAEVGDKLETTTAGEHITITGIETVVRKGVYAPFTMSGTIVVSDIKASNYVAYQDSDRLVIGGWTSPLSYQWLGHLSQGPHRIWVLVFGISEEEMYTDSGMSTWIDGPHWLGELFVVQHPLVMTLILIPVVSCLVVVSAIETVLAWVT